MEILRKITQDIVWVGGGERRLALFENLFPLDNGITYNSFIINDDKTALIDTVDASVRRQFLENVEAAMQGRPLDYLVVNHMEPDHCAIIEEVCRLYPQIKLVGNSKTFRLIRQFYKMDLSGRTVEVEEGDTLVLGRHTLRFIMAPMVHWPEVMFTYDTTDQVLFSADAFGSFGGYTGNLFSDETGYDEIYLNEMRRYYSNIVGKYGTQVKAVLNKLSAVKLQMICPLHGPVLRGNEMEKVLEKYRLWSDYKPEEAGVVIAYGSMYGNTENAVYCLANQLAQKGVRDIRIYDVSKTHYSYIVADAFRFSHLVIAAPTYNLKLYGAMETVLYDFLALNLRDRFISILGNGSWAPVAGREMMKIMGKMQGASFVGEVLEIQSTLADSQSPQLEALADAISVSVRQAAAL